MWKFSVHNLQKEDEFPAVDQNFLINRLTLEFRVASVAWLEQKTVLTLFLEILHSFSPVFVSLKKQKARGQKHLR